MDTTARPTLPPDHVRRALAGVRARSWTRLRRGAVFMVALCVAIAALLTAVARGGFGSNLIYSFAIGLSCWLITDGARVLTAWLAERARVLRGQPPRNDGFAIGWRGMLPLLVLGMLGGPVVGMAIGDAITGNRSHSLLEFGSPMTVVTLTLTVIGSLSALFVLMTLEHLADARAQAEMARREAAENQIKLLESQLEPHMLFNTLANLRVLIGTDSERAQAMLDRLIAFLRSTLNASRVGRHPLAAEFERAGDYLALMAVRMGPRLQIAFDLPAALREVQVPPLLLQPLVENAIKHGLEPKVDGGRIEISAARDDATLVLSVRDTGVGLGHPASSDGTRFGLEQVRSRLHTLYGEGAALSLHDSRDAGGGTLARITLPIDR